MANDGKIYIIVTDKYPGGGDGPSIFPSGEPQKKEKEDDSSVFKSWSFHQTIHFLESQAVKAVNYTISNIGNFTGDYQAQRDIQGLLSAVNKVKSIVQATVNGAVMGGVAGGVVGFVAAVGSEAINIALEFRSLEIQQKKSNHMIGILQQRSGLNTLRDGSRGTEN